MRSVVTGGAGFIGSAIAHKLAERGDEVVVVDDLSSGDRAAVPEGAQLVEVDIRDGDALQKAFAGAEVVWHQAALRSVPRSLDEPKVVHDVNATGTLNVLLAAERSGANRVIYASSSSVYGGALEGMSREDMAPNPLSPYAVSKLTGEYYCRVWSSLERIETVSLRYFNVFGPGQKADSKYAAVFPAFISALQEGRAPEIQWDGEQSRDFTFIDDVVAANLAAADAESPGGRVLNVAGGEPRTVNQIYADISAELGVDLEPVRGAKREGDIRHSYADPTEARELLGWKSQTSWDEAVKKTVAWFVASRA